MKKLNKTLSIILSVIMILSFIPLTASAVEYSGTCGENLTWILDDDGVLTISGTGDMTNYLSITYAPWYSTKNNIKSVIINNGVTSIGNSAFDYCEKLTSITIPESVDSIGRDSFSRCSALTDLVIPGSVKEIGTFAFTQCSALKKITLCEGIEKIDVEAFFNCNGIETVTIPSSVMSIGQDAFGLCCSLTSINVDKNNPNYSSDEYGVLYDKDKTKLIAYPTANTRISYEIPYGVTTIAAGAFDYNFYLINLTVPKSLAVVENYAFSSTEKLSNVFYYGTEEEWGNISVGSNDNSSFKKAKKYYECKGDESGIGTSCEDKISYEYDSKTKTLTISGEGPMPDYGQYNHPWRNYRREAKTVIINEGITSISAYAFDEFDFLKHVSIPNTVTSIGYRAFYLCPLESVTIPESVTLIDNAFSATYLLSYIYYTGTMSQWNDMLKNSDRIGYGGDYFIYCEDGCIPLTGTCGENLTWHLDGDTGILTISGSGAMDNYSNPNSVSRYAPWSGYSHGIKSVIIEEGVETIGKYAFDGCDLTDVSIPGSVKTIGDYAFYGCDLTDVSIPGSVKTIGDYAFYYGTTEISISEGVTTIGRYAFCGVEKITIPESVTEIGYCTFPGSTIYYAGTKKQWQTLEKEHNYLFTAYHRVYCSDGELLPSGVCGENTTWVFDDVTGVLTISGTGAIYDMADSRQPWDSSQIDVKVVNIGEGITSIGASAFKYLHNLKTATLPSTLKIIEDKAFYGCDSLKEITIPSSVTTIGSRAFSSCMSLSEIVIPGGVTSIGANTFAGCKSLGKIVIPDGVTSIGEYAFYFCESLKEIIIPCGVTTIGAFAFSGCSSLENVYYMGSEAQWNAIDKRTNSFMANTKVHCQQVHCQQKTIVNPPSCTEHGYTQSTCETCGYEYWAYTSNPTGHTFNDEGVCETCGEKEVTNTSSTANIQMLSFESILAMIMNLLAKIFNLISIS